MRGQELLIGKARRVGGVESGDRSYEVLVDLVRLNDLVAIEIRPSEIDPGGTGRIQRLGQLTGRSLIE